MGFIGRQICYFGAVFFTVSTLVLPWTLSASAQIPTLIADPIIWHGDAVVTGFSGKKARRPTPGADANAHLTIDQDGPALQIFDISRAANPVNTPLINAPTTFAVQARLIGQVFGIALDDGQAASGPPTDPDPIPNIYAAATSAYGLHLVMALQTSRGIAHHRTQTGSPNAKWMDGQFGTAIGGGPGSIWKINGRSGEVSLFANVALASIENTGAGLGALAFDPTSRRLFVSDMQTGLIFSYDLSGVQTGYFDHGLTGRASAGLAPVGFNPATRANILSPNFRASDPTSWGYTDWERLVRGIAIHRQRLYYATDAGPDIWSIGLSPSGGFIGSPRFEFAVETTSGDPVSSLKFSRDGTLYLSQRGQPNIANDFSTFIYSGSASVLRFRQARDQNGKLAWQPVADEYAIGKRPGHRSTPGQRSTNGGVALGYGYDSQGYIRFDACDATLWTTGEALRDNGAPVATTSRYSDANVHGLQGTPVGVGITANQSPDQAWYLDYDGVLDGANRSGQMGDVSIWGCSEGPSFLGPKTPGTAQAPIAKPDIRIAKSCLPANLGDFLHCTVETINRGTIAPSGPVGFADNATIMSGPYRGAFPQIVNINPDARGWRCSARPSPILTCEIGGNALLPGRRRSVDIIMDVSGMVGSPDFRARNCAALDDGSRVACVTIGADLIISKSGPDICEAGGLCSFQSTVSNKGRSTYNGNIKLVDVISIPGIDALTATWISPPLPGCDPSIVPFECVTPLTLGPGGSRTFEVTVEIPTNAVAPGDWLEARNCLVGADAELLNKDPSARDAFQRLTSNVIYSPATSSELSFQCTDFTIVSPLVYGSRNKSTTGTGNRNATAVARNQACPLPVAEVALTPTPAGFTYAGERIRMAIDISNTSIGPAEFINNWNVSSPELQNVTCPASAPVFMPTTVMNCDADYTVTQADMIGGKIVIGASFGGESTCGAIDPVYADVEMTEANPSVGVSVKQWPLKINRVGQNVAITTTIANTGNVTVSVTPTINVNGQSTTLSQTSIGPRNKLRHTVNGTVTTTDLKTGIVTTVSVASTTAAGQPLPVTISAPVTSVFVPAKPGQTGGIAFVAPPLVPARPGQTGGPGLIAPSLVPAIPGQTGGPGFAAGPFLPGGFGQTALPTHLSGLFVPAVPGQTGGPVPLADLPGTGQTAAAPQAAMSLDYTCNPQTYRSVNEPIGCIFTVVNTGNIDIADCEITGARMKVPCPPGVISPGQTTYAQGFYMSTAADIGKNIVLDFTLTGTPRP